MVTNTLRGGTPSPHEHQDELLRRADAAWVAIAAGADPALTLSLVVWPRPEAEQTTASLRAA
jgi:hypothetical protein